MRHKKYSHLSANEKYLLIESSGTVNKKKIYRSKQSDLQNIKNEIETFGYHKNTHYMNNLLIRNKNTNNLLAYTFSALSLLGKVKIDYYGEISQAIKEINNTKFNCLYMTPSIYWNFKDKMNLQHYEYIFLAGEQLSNNIKEKLLNSTNAKIFDMYGSTDSGLVAYKNIRYSDYHITVPSITLIKNTEGKIEFLKEKSGACDFIEDENGIKDLTQNKTYIGDDFIEFIDNNKFNFIGRDDSFVKINEIKIYLDQVKNYLLNKLKPIDIKLLKYKDENNFDQFCMYLISEKECEVKYLIDLILEEYNSIIYMPKKVLTAKEYLTKNINSGELIKTDTKKLLQLVLENGKQSY
jgi:acyl-coenzyme A synthetase/AMP-(fatty) acid ligase